MFFLMQEPIYVWLGFPFEPPPFLSLSEGVCSGCICLTSLRWPWSKPNGPKSPGQGAALGCHWPKSLPCSTLRVYKVSQSLFELVGPWELMYSWKYLAASPPQVRQMSRVLSCPLSIPTKLIYPSAPHLQDFTVSVSAAAEALWS